MCCVCCVVEIAFGVYVLFSLRHLQNVFLAWFNIYVCLVSLCIVRCVSAYVLCCVFMVDAFCCVDCLVCVSNVVSVACLLLVCLMLL